MNKILNFCKVTGKRVEKFEGKRKYVATGDIVDNKIESYELVSFENKPSRANQEVKVGDVLFAKMKDTVKVIQIDEENVKNIYSTGFFVITPNENVKSRYLYWLFNSKKFNDEKNKNCKGATQKALNLENLSKIYIDKLLAFEEQEMIIKQLDKVQEIIDLRKKQIEELDELIKSQFAQVTKDIIDEVELNYFAYGLNAGKSLVGEAECKNKVLKTGSVSYDHFDKNEIKNLPINYIPNEKHKVKKGDVIISRMNTAELVGACGYVWNDIENVYYPDRLWRLNLKQNCNPIFIWQSIIQKKFKEKIKLICSGTSGSMKNISQEKFLKLTIKNVPKELQDKFAELVKKINKQKYMLEKNLKETEELKESLMNKYFG